MAMATKTGEDIVQEVQDLCESILQTTDVDTAKQIAATMAKTRSTRKAALAESVENLNTLKKELARARVAATRLPGYPTAEDNAETLRRLEAERYALAKRANEGEARNRALEAELLRLREDVAQIDAELGRLPAFPDGPDELRDTDAIKVHLYRDFGVRLSESVYGSHVYDQVTVRLAGRDDEHTFRVDGKQTPFFTTKRIWDLISR